jgi:CSLREA domain-containing protein
MLPAAAFADTVTVNTTADHNDKVCDATDCTLREGVELGANTINLPKGNFKLDPALGELVLVNDQIDGAGARASIIDGSSGTRVLRVLDGVSSIDGVTVTHGNGASSVSNGAGGGIFVGSGSTLQVTTSTVDSNTATSGGGIGISGTLILDRSTVSGNRASTGRLSSGGGITNAGTTLIANSTISGNTAVDVDGASSQGGGIASSGPLTFNGVTISNNTAINAAGLLENVPASGAARTILNTIVSGNIGPECGGTGLDTDTTHNSLSEDTTCAFGDATDLPPADAQLRALANNGGGTNTHALLSTSPAINKGNGCAPVSAPVDQRGVVRPQAGTACDVGAFEYRPHALTVVTHVVNDNGGALTAAGVTVHVRVDGADTKGSPAAGLEGGRAYSLLTGDAFVVTANDVPGYSLSYSTGCSGAIVEGGTNTCTVTVDDIQPKLTVKTAVTNDNGGTKAPGDFTLHVRSGGADVAGSPAAGTSTGRLYTLNAGTYAVAADGLTGYSLSGMCSVTLVVGDDKTCTITADDIAPKLKVITIVQNTHGGTAIAADFSTHVRQGGRDVSGSPQAGSGTGTPYTLSAGDFSVSAEGVPGYSATGSGACAANGSVTLALGDDKNCTITVADGAPRLTVTTQVVNDNGGTKVPSDFLAHVRTGVGDVTGSPQVGTTSGTLYSLVGGLQYTVAADPVSGYTMSISGDCAANGTVTPVVGQPKSCTITANDVAPTLTVITTVTNDNGGTATPAGFTIHVRNGGADVGGSPAAGSAGGTTYTLVAGSYAVAADAVPGYFTAIGGACAADGSVSLAPGDAKTCTVAPNDTSVSSLALPPPVIYKSMNLLPSQGTVLIKLPGSKNFVAIVDGQQVPVGTIVDVRKGRVTLIAAADANGDTAQAVFYGGIFKLGSTKSKTPTTVLSLVEKLTGCNAKGKATIAKKKVKKRRLWGDGHGNFQTKGKHSAATVVGTKWLVQDTCSSTLTKVARGRVKVRDFEKHKTVFVTKGHKYVARARP